MIDVDKLEAGPELDALVAEKVFGWTKKRSTVPMRGPLTPEWVWVAPHSTWGLGHPGESYPVGVPNYSTDIAAAWEVFEKLAEIWKDKVVLVRNVHGRYSCIADLKQDTGAAESAPLAICRAALKAVGHA